MHGVSRASVPGHAIVFVGRCLGVGHLDPQAEAPVTLMQRYSVANILPGTRLGYWTKRVQLPQL